MLTTEPAEWCWRREEPYAARWTVEPLLRCGKSELGCGSIRVHAWEARRRLLGLVSRAGGS